MGLNVNLNKLNGKILYVIFFMTYIGFYCFLLLGIQLGFNHLTDVVSVPLRLVIDFFCLLLLIINIKQIQHSNHLFFFVLFTVIYLLRIMFDYAQAEPFYIEYGTLVLYYVSFCCIPFVTVHFIKLNRDLIEKIFKAIVFSSLIFSVLAVSFYGRFIGSVERLSSGQTNESVISPLILSYCAALGIGVILMYLIYNKVTKKNIVVYLGIIGISLIPLLLGATRGSFFSIFIPFIYLGIVKGSFKNWIKGIFLMIIVFFILLSIDLYLGTGYFARLFAIGDAVKSHSSSASRIDIWKESWGQFLENPFFGDKLKTNNFAIYPHNILLEILQSVGLFGFIPFFILLIKCFKSCTAIFRNNGKFAWIPVLFLQAFMQNMFSGSIYTASWFWLSMGLVFCTNIYLENERNCAS